MMYSAFIIFFLISGQGLCGSWYCEIEVIDDEVALDRVVFTLKCEWVDGFVLGAVIVDSVLFMSDQIGLAIAVVIDRLAELVGYLLGDDAAIVDYSLFH